MRLLARDHVEHDADALRELVEEDRMNWLKDSKLASSMTALAPRPRRGSGRTSDVERRRLAEARAMIWT